jgi:hypothetical protein
MMFVTITEGDRTVVEFDVPFHGEAQATNALTVLCAHDGTYVMVFGVKGSLTGELQWRGTLGQVMSKFADEVSDFEHDFVLEQQ